MKGLLRNNFYSMGSNLQLSFIISFVLIFIPLILGDENFLSMVLAMQSFMFIANIGTALNTDINTKWSNFEITLPIKRKDIIKARYTSFLMLILCGILMSSLTVILNIVVFETLSKNSVIFGFSFGVSLSLLTSSLMYPLMLKIGTEKNEMIIFICAAIATALFLLFVNFIAPFVPNDLMLSGRSLLVMMFTLFSVVVFILSYFLSLCIYKRKEL